MPDAPLVLLLTHSGDFFTIDRVGAAVERRGMQTYRFDTDRFPAEVTVAAHLRDGGAAVTIDDGEQRIDLSQVRSVWMRRLWSPRGLSTLDPRWRGVSQHHCRVALTQLLPLLPETRWLDRIDVQLAAESKPRQLIEATAVGLSVPETMVTNSAAAARQFVREQPGSAITKLLEPIAYSMQGGDGDFAYTSRVEADDLPHLETLRWVPQIFQPEVPKSRELRVVMVGSRCFVGAIDTRKTARGQVDWRRLRADEGPPWQAAELPTEVAERGRALLDRLGLTFGVLDFIVTPADEHILLEVNPAGEWGWLERDLDLPIADAIGEWLVHGETAVNESDRDDDTTTPATANTAPAAQAVVTQHAAPQRDASPSPPPSTSTPTVFELVGRPRQDAPAMVASVGDRPAVLIITHSGDNECIKTVSAEIERRGGLPVRMNTDRYPTQVGLSTVQSRGGTGLIVADGKRVALESLQAVWYRRFAAGGRIPPSIGDTREAAVGETRRTLHGTIANLPCFQLDPLAAVQRTHHKELQLRLAAQLGLDVPRTLVTNRAEDARDFWHRLEGRVVTKMQHSFAIYRNGQENVVYTTRVKRSDLDSLDGLRLCPMTFQEELTKHVELRVTIVGTKVMAASIDSGRRAVTEVDWRRDGIGLMSDWQSYTLPEDVTARLLALQRQLGLNYGAADFIVTPQGRHVFLEVNPVGEFFWLDRDPGLPISEEIAAVLLGHAQRNVDRLGG